MLSYKRRIPWPSYLSCVDFEISSEKKFRLKLFHRETDGIRSVRKTSILLSPRFPIGGGEQLRRCAVIKSYGGSFGHGCVCHLIISKYQIKVALSFY